MIQSILLLPLKLIFYYPGRLILWSRYFFPQKSKKGGFISVAESRRQFKEGGVIVAVITSVIFWIPLVFLFLSARG